MSQPNAPIALFCFNRPQHLERTLDSLMACTGYDTSPMFVYSDGPRHEADRPLVDAVREVLARRLPASTTVVARPANVGLAANIIEGVTALCQTHGRVIVLEDDLLLDPRFLHFMNEALRRYVNVAHVYQVAGYMFETPALAGRSEALMLPWPTSWGWATWQRAWQHFDPTARGWENLAHDRGLRRRFNLDNNYDYASMLERQMTGEHQSWGVRWYWTLFQAAALAVYPPLALWTTLALTAPARTAEVGYVVSTRPRSRACPRARSHCLMCHWSMNGFVFRCAPPSGVAMAAGLATRPTLCAARSDAAGRAEHDEGRTTPIASGALRTVASTLVRQSFPPARVTV